MKLITYIALFMLVVVPFSLTAQTNSDNYSAAWKQAELYAETGLPLSAIKVADSIMVMSKSDGETMHELRALLFKLRQMETIVPSNEFTPMALQTLDTYILTSQAPEKQVAWSAKGDLIATYFNANRYQILNKSEGIEGNALINWSVRQFDSVLYLSYSSSVSERDVLQTVPYTAYKSLLTTDGDESVFPTLFDFLTHRAIDFFSRSSGQFNDFSKQTAVEMVEATASISDFLAVSIKLDSTDYCESAFSLYQQLMRFHLQNKNIAALLQNNLSRLQFAKALFTGEDLEQKYRSALMQVVDGYKDCPQVTDYYYALAEVSKTNLEKIDLCRKAIALFPESDGALRCKILKINLEKPTLSITGEQSILPDSPALALISYTNVEHLYFNIYSLTFEEYYQQDHESTDFNKKKNLVATWKVELPDLKDYNTHSKEVVIPNLPLGMYYVELKSSLSVDSVVVVSGYSFQVTNCVVVIQKQIDSGMVEVSGRLLDRQSGLFLKNVDVEFWKTEPRRRLQPLSFEQISVMTSGDDGQITINRDEENQSYVSGVFKVKSENHFLIQPTHISWYKPNRPKTDQRKSYLFTDRAIYRPGQTIYLNMVSLIGHDTTWNLLEDQEIHVTLRDPNGSEVAQRNLKTNRWGSVSASFTIPISGVNGNYWIQSDYGSRSIEVSEYKRPKFEIDLKSGGVYKPGDLATVDGEANALSGFPIENATVRYTVKRQRVTPYWRDWYSYRDYNRGLESESIAAGETVSDSQGKFQITFPTKEEEEMPYRPFYYLNYVVTADVTDISGETHSKSLSLKVAKNPLIVEANIPDQLLVEEANSFAIMVTNLDGDPIVAQSEVKIYRLKDESTLVKERLWAFPEFEALPEAEFVKQFPDYAYCKPKPIIEWERQDCVLERNLDFGDTAVSFTAQKWGSGDYILEVKTTDSLGNKAQFSKPFIVEKWGQKKVVAQKQLYASLNNSEPEVGEEIVLTVGSASPKLAVLMAVYRGETLVSKEVITLKNEQIQRTIPVVAADRGGFSISLSAVDDNRFYTEQFKVSVPFENSVLDLKLETFRSVLEPGMDEKWTINVVDHNGNPVEAALVATLYDASLDLLSTNSWNFYTPVLRANPVMISTNTFESEYGWSNLFHDVEYPRIPYIDVPLMNWFGTNYNRNYRRTSKMEAPMAAGMVESEHLGMSPLQEDKEDQIPQPTAEPKPVELRRNLNELAFFYANRTTDTAGSSTIEFTVPEALTEWHFKALAYTKKLQSGAIEQFVKTQKAVMVVPNLPRFLRQGDTAIISAKIVNLTTDTVSVEPKLEFIHPVSNQFLNADYQVELLHQKLEIKPNSSAVAEWRVIVPKRGSSVVCEISASTEKHSDGEAQLLPILPSRMVLTDALPMQINGGERKTYLFEAFENTISSVDPRALMVEFAENPAWYAVAALPNVVSPRYKCATTTVDALYAEFLVGDIIAQNPQIAYFFKAQRAQGGEALNSPLFQKENLKIGSLEATTFMGAARTEEEQRASLEQLFDKNRNQAQLETLIFDLTQLQNGDGSMSWFPGGKPSYYSTRYVVQILGELIPLAEKYGFQWQLEKEASRAVKYLDRQLAEKVNVYTERGGNYNLPIAALYARSLWLERIPITDNTFEAIYFSAVDTAFQSRVHTNIYLQGMLANTLLNLNRDEDAIQIAKSLKEHALSSPEEGLYWRPTNTWHWYDDEISRQAMLIALFDRMGYSDEVEQMKQWLLIQKRSNAWEGDAATASACFALLNTGGSLLQNSGEVKVKVGDIVVDAVSKEVGTGYFSHYFSSNEITPAMGRVEVENRGESLAWGALYWQYEQEMREVISSDGELTVDRQFYVSQLVDGSEQYVPVSGTNVAVGDRVKIILSIHAGANFEYVHLQDLRPANLEPENSTSGYVWSSKSPYYYEVKDASVNLFFDQLRKGDYQVEYSCFVVNAGDYSAGPAQIQCLYAPEFTAHSEGFSLRVK